MQVVPCGCLGLVLVRVSPRYTRYTRRTEVPAYIPAIRIRRGLTIDDRLVVSLTRMADLFPGKKSISLTMLITETFRKIRFSH